MDRTFIITLKLSFDISLLIMRRIFQKSNKTQVIIISGKGKQKLEILCDYEENRSKKDYKNLWTVDKISFGN